MNIETNNQKIQPNQYKEIADAAEKQVTECNNTAQLLKSKYENQASCYGCNTIGAEISLKHVLGEQLLSCREVKR